MKSFRRSFSLYFSASVFASRVARGSSSVAAFGFDCCLLTLLSDGHRKQDVLEAWEFDAQGALNPHPEQYILTEHGCNFSPKHVSILLPLRL